MRYAVLLSVFVPLSLLAADPDYAKELPRIPPTVPKDALKTFVLKPGYKLELVASEPLIASPVAVAWDENSRLYVVEMRGYSEDRNDKLSRVKLLESTKGDGVYDKATVFADGLLWPTAVACWDGGVFVGDAPNIYYLKDTDGDGKADVKKVVFTGFGTHNVQGLLNTFLWTLDNRIHGTASSCGGTISKPGDPAFQPLNINGRDFDFDPRSLDLRATSGGAQHGMTFDDWGHKFVSSNSDHIQQVMYEDRSIARNPYLIAPPPRVSIATDGPQAEVFPAAAPEPWRVVRTRLRVQGITPGIVEGGGRASGYFTGATGVTIYRGDAAPDLKGQAFIGDACSSLVHRKKLTLPVGSVQYRADRIDKDSEFLASRDNWFRPVQFANGPDGCLTMIDMYRETIEHPASLPPPIKKHLDLTSGRDRGRLWRVMPEGHSPRPLPKLGAMTTAELVKLLDHPNAWHRETASRLLYERQDKTAVGVLREMVAKGDGHGRTHAAYSLIGMHEKLQTEDLDAITSSTNPNVREHAARLVCDNNVDFGGKFPLSTKPIIVMKLLEDIDPQVRYQAAFGSDAIIGLGDAVRGVPGAAHLLDTNEKLIADMSNKHVRGALLSSLTPSMVGVFDELMKSPESGYPPSTRQFLIELVSMISRRDRETDAKTLATTIGKIPATEATLLLSLIQAVNEGGGRNTQAAVAAAVSPELVAKLVRAATATALAAEQSVTARVEAVRNLALGQPADVRDTLVKLLDLKQPGEVQVAALGVLDKFNDAGLPDTLVKLWPTLSPRLRAAAGAVLLSRPPRVTALLDAIEKRQFAPQNLDATQIKLLTTHKDAAIQKRAAALLAAFKPARRTDVIAKYRPALDAKGDAAKGKAIFQKNCAACHKLEGVGHELGPNLSAMKNRGAEAILTNVLDPNAEVNPQYLNYTGTLDDGRQVTGIIQAETATSVTFIRGEGLKDVVARANIDTLKSTGVSLMPEGIEKEISVEGMADLIAYLMSVP